MPMRNCPHDEELRQYIFQAEKNGRDEIAIHLESCAHCRSRMERMMSELQTKIYAANKTAGDTLKQSEPASDSRREIPKKRGKRKRRDKERASQQTSFRLIASNNEVFVHAVTDPLSEDSWLYVLTEGGDLNENVLVKPLEFGTWRLTDDLGRINLGRLDKPPSKRVIADVRFPRSKFRLIDKTSSSKDERPIELTDREGYRLKVSVSGKRGAARLDIDILEIAENTDISSMLMAIKCPGTSKIQVASPSPSGKVTFENVEASGGLILLLY